jgi:hypothetical protein
MQEPSGELEHWSNNSKIFKTQAPDRHRRSSLGLNQFFNWEFFSNAKSNVTQGRVICRLVSMFESVDELVEENDRRRTLEAESELDEEPPEHTLEYNFLLVTCY